MSAARKIDSELDGVLSSIPKGSRGVFDITDIPGTREAVRQMAVTIAAQAPEYPNITMEELNAVRPDGGEVTLRLLRPDTGDDLPVLLWFHGGGQVLGFAAQDDPSLKRLIDEVSCAVVAVDYRLAPEAPAPAAAEDGLAAYRFILGNASSLRLDPRRIGIAGESGGGGIAAAVCLMVRDGGLPTPLFQGLFYPMLDDRNATLSSEEVVDVGVWDRETNLLAWKAILGKADSEVSEYQAPARATRFDELPPTFLAVAEIDVLRDEGLHYGSQLIAAGVPVDLHHFAGAFHGFYLLAPESRLARQFTSMWFDYLKNMFAR
ncbi:alpha/beta hydrolase fold domain-containing protein [Nonomuraea endophytica]|uniref:alpha/beta hydrolase fold domain-containing protein n=1 Tax=Nonomuraea endophytica TaxID=714136 RepID=UPI0037CB9E89